MKQCAQCKKVNPVQAADSTARAYAPATDTSFATNSVSYTTSDGKLVFITDCYVIITGSFAEEINAVNSVNTLKGLGYTNCGYFWRMDYPSIADKYLYSTFIGPFENYADCNRELSIYKQSNRFAYGIKVSYENIRTEFK